MLFVLCKKRTYQIISQIKHLLFITENNNQMFTRHRRCRLDAAEQCGQRSQDSKREGSGGEREKEITPWVYYVQDCDTLWLSALVWQNGERGRKTWRFTEEIVHIVQPCVASPQFTSYPCTVSQFFPKGLPILTGLVPFLSKCLSMENHWPSFGESKGLGMYEPRITCFTVYPMHRTVKLWNPKCIF